MRWMLLIMMVLFLCSIGLSGEKAEPDLFAHWAEEITKLLAEPHEPSPTVNLHLHRDWAEDLLWVEKLYSTKAKAAHQLREALLKEPDTPITQEELTTLSFLTPKGAISYTPPTPVQRSEALSKQISDFQRQILNSINRLESRLYRLESDLAEVRRRVISIDTKYR